MAAELESKSYDELDRLANAEFSKYKIEFEDKIKTDNKKIETFNLIWAKVLRQQFTAQQGVGNLGPQVIINNNNNQPQPPRPQAQIEAEKFAINFNEREKQQAQAKIEKKNRLKLPQPMGVPKFLTGMKQNVNPLRQDKKKQDEEEKKRRENEEKVRNQQSGDQSSSNESDRGRKKGSNEGDDDEDDDIIDVDEEENKMKKIKQKPQKNKEEEEEEEERVIEREIVATELDNYFIKHYYDSTSKVKDDILKKRLLMACDIYIRIGNKQSPKIRVKLANEEKLNNVTTFDSKPSSELFRNNCAAIKKEIESVQNATNKDKSLKVEIEINFDKDLFYYLCARYQFEYNEKNLLNYIKLMTGENEGDGIMTLLRNYETPPKLIIRADTSTKATGKTFSIKRVNYTQAGRPSVLSTLDIDIYGKDETLLFFFPPNLFFLFAVFMTSMFGKVKGVNYFSDKYGNMRLRTIDDLKNFREEIDKDYKKFHEHHVLRRTTFNQQLPNFFSKFRTFNSFLFNYPSIIFLPEFGKTQELGTVQLVLDSQDWNPDEDDIISSSQNVNYNQDIEDIEDDD